MSRRIALACALTLAASAQVPPAASKKPLPDDIVLRVRPVMDAIHSLDYPTAERLCKTLIQDLPEHPAGYEYLARTYWSEQLSHARLLSTERFVAMDLFSDSPRFRLAVERASHERFNRAGAESLEKARAWSKRHPADADAQFFLATAYAIMAGYELSIERNRWKATKSSGEAYEAAQDLVRRFPDFADARLITGAVNFVADNLDWKTKWLSWLLGYRGSQDKGRQDLEIAADQGTLTSDDARTFLAVLHTREKQMDKATRRLAELHERHPDNYLVHLDIAAAAWLMDRPTQALETYREILAKNYPELERTFVLSRIGAASRMAGDFNASERWLRNAVEAPGTSPRLLAVAYLEFGKTLDLLNRRDGALAQYRHVLQLEDFLGLHQEAESFIRKPFDVTAMRQDQGAGGLVTLK
jgi:tetratricopeptide (TPR) repeat protein